MLVDSKVKRFDFAPEMSFLTSGAKRSCFVSKGRRSIELPEIALFERFVIDLFSVPISLCHRFSIATTYLLNRSVFSISVSDVDSDFSLQLEGIAEKENAEWWEVLQVGVLYIL